MEAAAAARAATQVIIGKHLATLIFNDDNVRVAMIKNHVIIRVAT